MNDFWNWAKISSKEYSERSYGNKIEEFFYPRWDELIKYAKNIVDNQNTSDEMIDSLLTIMAIDNEREELLDFISNYANNSYIYQLIKRGATHVQPQARYQIVELIKRHPNKIGIQALKSLINDPFIFVSKRAINTLNELTM